MTPITMAAWTPSRSAQINQARVDADQSTATPVMDWNQDGCIDYTEFSAAPYSLFDQLDADHDGKLTPKELQRAGAKPGRRCRADAEPAAEDGAAAGGRGGGGGGRRPPPGPISHWLVSLTCLTGQGSARTSAPFARRPLWGTAAGA